MTGLVLGLSVYVLTYAHCVDKYSCTADVHSVYEGKDIDARNGCEKVMRAQKDYWEARGIPSGLACLKSR
jgi:hypothetical protein